MKKDNSKYNRNTLSESKSPYLLQHKNNPVWWHELNKEVLNHAKESDKPVLLSSGYSTCHWCHVMAGEAFSDKETADYLNENFVCIKIDREMQPDVDSWMMAYMQSETGQGGWPLNVFTNHELKPFFSMMYAPAEEGQYGRPSFLKIIKYVNKHFSSKKNSLEKWQVSNIIDTKQIDSQILSDDENRLSFMYNYFDITNGGITSHQKFPPHSALFHLLYINHNVKEVDDFVRYTLATMHNSGLHDHLQGGFYRYCVDSKWTIPHFEKMLYDQAMMLMNYSLAYKKYKSSGYKYAVEQLVKCLDESFAYDSLYIAAHDADAEGKEGLTYLWTINELKEILNDEEYRLFHNCYTLKEYENRYHLIKNDKNISDESFEKLKNIENKLLQARKFKPQAFKDKKLISSWNALTGIGLLFASRYAGFDLYDKALSIYKAIMKNHKLPNGKIAHSSINEKAQNESFLEDIASMFLFATFLYEDRLIDESELNELYDELIKYKHSNNWIESNNEFLGKIDAEYVDHPYPSSISMAEMAIARYKPQTNQDTHKLEFLPPLNFDFYNIAAKINRGDFPVIKSPEKISYDDIPAGAIQMYDKTTSICMNNTCREADVKDIKKSFN